MMNTFTIFLDFDGVMVTKFSVPSTSHPGLAFDPVCVDNLKLMINSLKSKYEAIEIVVISNWRYDMDEAAIGDMLLKHYGFVVDIDEVKFTRKLGNKEAEIREYLDINQIPPNLYIIFDDENLGEELAEGHIRTRFEDGIRDVDFTSIE